MTALGADRPGIVNTITRHVSSCGCNIEDSRLAMLGDEFTFIIKPCRRFITTLSHDMSSGAPLTAMHKTYLQTFCTVPAVVTRQ
ncbi:hypothetical protein MJL33_33540, partial [Salmonella enterica subsp. enterica serovar Kentucky]|nr:hypothetical protein [Salmonella enterica subsp. enterica serovar Kentucky]